MLEFTVSPHAGSSVVTTSRFLIIRIGRVIEGTFAPPASSSIFALFWVLRQAAYTAAGGSKVTFFACLGVSLSIARGYSKGVAIDVRFIMLGSG